MTKLHQMPRDARVTAMAQMVKGACEGYLHEDVLSALMTAFRDVAMKYPCCHDSVVKMCLEVMSQVATQGRDDAATVPAPSRMQ